MNILIIGAGAIGCLVGAKLAMAGYQVTLVGRQRTQTALEEHGLRLRDERGNHEVGDVRVITSVADALDGAYYDYVMLTVKSYDTGSAVNEIAEVTNSSSWPTVLSLQNGVGNEETIASALCASSVIAGTITTPVSVSGPGYVTVEKPDYTLGISQWHPAVSNLAFDAARKSLAQAGFAVQNYPNAQGMKWTKLLLNMVGNASCAILDASPQWVFENEQTANLEIGAWRETLAVMHAAGIPPANIGSYPFTVLAPLVRRTPRALLRLILKRTVGEARGGKMPSLHIDLESGRPKSEVGWLNGATVKRGSEVGVETPVNRTLTEVLSRLVENPSERDAWRHNAKRLVDAVDTRRQS